MTTKEKFTVLKKTREVAQDATAAIQPLVPILIPDPGSLSVVNAIDPSLLDALDNVRERIFILRLEQDIISFLASNRPGPIELESMNSYQRLLAHRTGDYYKLLHVNEGAKNQILLSRSPLTRIPPIKLCDVSSKISAVEEQQQQQQLQGFKIMKRDSARSSAATTPRSNSATDLTTKDMERKEKEERYKAARARIFEGVEEKPIVDAGNINSTGNAKPRNRRKQQNKDTDESDLSDYVRDPPYGQMPLVAMYNNNSFYYDQDNSFMYGSRQHQQQFQPNPRAPTFTPFYEQPGLAYSMYGQPHAGADFQAQFVDTVIRQSVTPSHIPQPFRTDSSLAVHGALGSVGVTGSLSPVPPQCPLAWQMAQAPQQPLPQTAPVAHMDHVVSAPQSVSTSPPQDLRKLAPPPSFTGNVWGPPGSGAYRLPVRTEPWLLAGSKGEGLASGAAREEGDQLDLANVLAKLRTDSDILP